MGATARWARRTTAGLVAALTIAGGTALAGAPAAQAIARPALTGCSLSDLHVTSGTRTDFLYPAGCTEVTMGWIWNAVPLGTGDADVFFDAWGAVGATPYGDEAVAIYTTDGTCGYVQYVVSDGWLGAPLQAAKTCPSDPIPGWAQGYGRHLVTDTCLDGWNPSWEQWANGGNGGYVCSRVIPSLG